MDEPKAPFSKGTPVGELPQGLVIEHDLDRRLIERTVDLWQGAGGAAWPERATGCGLGLISFVGGGGRVEDTYNLLVDALRKGLGVIARQSRGGGWRMWRSRPEPLPPPRW